MRGSLICHTCLVATWVSERSMQSNSVTFYEQILPIYIGGILPIRYIQGRIKGEGGNRGNWPGPPTARGLPVMIFICFKQNTRLKNFVIQSRYKNTTLYYTQGRSQSFLFGGATGGASFATRGAVNGLCRTFRKRPTPAAWRHPEKFGGQWPPWHPHSSAPDYAPMLR